MLITGGNGFIGKEISGIRVLANDLPKRGHFDYLLHFGSPSSQILFNEDNSCIKETIVDFIKVVEFCKKKHVKLIFPSSGTVYNKNNSYSHTKSALEEIANAYGVNYLALRIFAGYGPGEAHKKDYASIIYQWICQIKKGISPEIYGDGEQTRDFVYIDDIVKNIKENLDKTGIMDIGTGINTPFNRIIQIINKELNTSIEPIYIKSPGNYIKETICQNPLKEFISVKEGIKLLCQKLKF
jgi:nucleoside-diphosphate-sugar epimerase